MTTYQRNIVLPPTQQNLLRRHCCPDLVVDPEIGADDEAGDEHDDGALDDLVLAGPFDLLQLGDALADEAEANALKTLPPLPELPAASGRGAVALRADRPIGLRVAMASATPGGACASRTSGRTS